MQRYVARENIKRFKGQLENCSDEQDKETLKQLLAAEEEKLEELERAYRQSAQPSDSAIQNQCASSESPTSQEQI